MKKIANHPNGLRLDGVVESDGVGYLPVKELGPMSVQTSGFFATIDKEEVIKCQIFSGDEEEGQVKMANRIKAKSNHIMIGAIACIIACIVLMFVSISWPYAKVWTSLFMSLAYLILIVMLMPKAIAILVGRITRDEEMINFSKYLGAKNAVENAYYDLGRTPNIEEVRDYSCYSIYCPYTKNSYLACLVLLISVVRFLNGWWYWLAAILAIIVMSILESKNCLNFWQVLTVSKPDENHYRVAIRAMEDTEELIDSIQISYHKIETTPDPENFDSEKCEGCPAYDFCKEASDEIKSKEEKKEEIESETVSEDAAVEDEVNSES